MQNFNEMEAQKCAFERSAAQTLGSLEAKQRKLVLQKQKWDAKQQ